VADCSLGHARDVHGDSRHFGGQRCVATFDQLWLSCPGFCSLPVQQYQSQYLNEQYCMAQHY
jgi:hypothetical protein